VTHKPAPRASEPPGDAVSPSRTPESHPPHADASAARTAPREWSHRERQRRNVWWRRRLRRITKPFTARDREVLRLERKIRELEEPHV
jgi:hypothetical protein